MAVSYTHLDVYKRQDGRGDDQGIKAVAEADAHGLLGGEFVVHEYHAHQAGQGHGSHHGVVGGGEELHQDEGGHNEHHDGGKGFPDRGQVLGLLGVVQMCIRDRG